MSWNFTMGLISTVSLFLPIALIIALRLSTYRSFPYLLGYYVFVFAYNLFTEGYINPGGDVIYYWGLTNNLLDAPLMLSFLTYFSTSASFTRKMRIVTLLLLVFDAIVVIWGGFNVSILTVVLAPGLVAVLSFCLIFFVRQTKITIMHQKATGKALMISSLLFAYGCFSFIYLIFYVFKTKDVANTFLIYFFVTTLSSLLMCAGLILEKKRVRKLVELKVVRKELSSLYNEPKTTIPFQKAFIDKGSTN
jgi:hypothetical protein